MKAKFRQIIEALADNNEIIETGASKVYPDIKFMNININGCPVKCEYDINDDEFVLSYKTIKDRNKNAAKVYARINEIIDTQFPEYMVGEFHLCFQFQQKFVLF